MTCIVPELVSKRDYDRRLLLGSGLHKLLAGLVASTDEGNILRSSDVNNAAQCHVTRSISHVTILTHGFDRNSVISNRFRV
jgi:hypothetical protein